jgi:hypothetical protein
MLPVLADWWPAFDARIVISSAASCRRRSALSSIYRHAENSERFRTVMMPVAGKRYARHETKAGSEDQ